VNGSVTVREASVEDAEGIARVRVLGWQAAYRGIVPDAFLDEMSVAEDVQRMQSRAWDSELRPHFVCEVDGEIVGWTCVFLRSRDEGLGPDVAEVAACYVLPAYWGQGVGYRMMAVAIEAARRRGVASMILWVLEDNEQARRFYARQGFVPDGARKMEGHVPDAELAVIRMCRSL